MRYWNYLFNNFSKKILLFFWLVATLVLFSFDLAVDLANFNMPDLSDNNVIAIKILTLHNILFLTSLLIITTYFVYVLFIKINKTKNLLLENSMYYSRKVAFIIKSFCPIFFVLVFTIFSYYVTLNLAVVSNNDMLEIINQKSYNSAGYAILFWLVMFSLLLAISFLVSQKGITLVLAILLVFNLSSLWTAVFNVESLVEVNLDHLAANYENKKLQQKNFSYITQEAYNNDRYFSDETFYGSKEDLRNWRFDFADNSNFSEVIDKVISQNNITLLQEKLANTSLVISNIKYHPLSNQKEKLSEPWIAYHNFFEKSPALVFSLNKVKAIVDNENFLKNIPYNLRSEMTNFNIFSQKKLVTINSINMQTEDRISVFEKLSTQIVTFLSDQVPALKDKDHMVGQIWNLINNSYLVESNYAHYLLISNFTQMFCKSAISYNENIIKFMKKKRIFNWLFMSNQINICQISNFDPNFQVQDGFILYNYNISNYQIGKDNQVLIKPDNVTRDVNPTVIIFVYIFIFLLLTTLTFMIYWRRDIK